MNYWQFWASFWRDMSQFNENGEPPVGQTAPPPAADFTAKEKYDHLSKYGTQILCLISPAEGCYYLSRNFETITGNKAALGDDFYALVHEDYRARFRELTAKTSAKPHAFRCKLRHDDGQYYWYQFMLHHEGAGEFVCIIENIHDHMLTQNTLQKAKLEAELALRARSEFLAGMSHDLRTPLNAVIGFAQLIESEMFGKLQNPQYIEYVKHIQESGYDLLAKIEDLLEISNIDAGRTQLDTQEVTASEILKQVTEAQAHHAHAAHVSLQLVCPKSDIALCVDRLKLQHILGHLVSNAIENCREGGSIVLEAAKSPEGGAELRVRDNGSGIPKPKLAEITEALKEENCWAAGTNRSIGLGLALTREFVALHGGEVDVQSGSGGTCVSIALPKTCIASAKTQKSALLQEAV